MAHDLKIHLPCLSAAGENEQEQQFIALESVKEATESRNEHLLAEVCPLVLEHLWSLDDKKFLRNKLAIVQAKNIGTYSDYSQVELGLGLIKHNMGCLKITGCGHVFCAVPLLYMFVTSSFRCPVCRFGNSARVDMSQKPPPNLPQGVWETLSVLSKLTAQREIREQLDTMNNNLEEITQESFMDIYAMIPWQMAVSVYRQADAAPGDTPHACVHMKMRQETAQIQGTDILFSSGTLSRAPKPFYAQRPFYDLVCPLHHLNPTLLKTGHRGPTRLLANLLRECECFFTEIFVDCDTTRHVLYQSKKTFSPVQNGSTTQQTKHKLSSSPTATGICHFEYDKCFYSRHLLLRGINYTVPEHILRNFVLDISRPTLMALTEAANAVPP